MKFIDEIKARAKQDVKTIVLPESRDKRTLIAAAQVLKEGTAKIVMVGDEEKIRDGAHWLDVRRHLCCKSGNVSEAGRVCKSSVRAS